jgi:hypothetical protein
VSKAYPLRDTKSFYVVDTQRLASGKLHLHQINTSKYSLVKVTKDMLKVPSRKVFTFFSQGLSKVKTSLSSDLVYLSTRRNALEELIGYLLVNSY